MAAARAHTTNVHALRILLHTVLAPRSARLVLLYRKGGGDDIPLPVAPRRVKRSSTSNLFLTIGDLNENVTWFPAARRPQRCFQALGLLWLALGRM